MTCLREPVRTRDPGLPLPIEKVLSRRSPRRLSRRARRTRWHPRRRTPRCPQTGSRPGGGGDQRLPRERARVRGRARFFAFGCAACRYPDQNRDRDDHCAARTEMCCNRNTRRKATTPRCEQPPGPYEIPVRWQRSPAYCRVHATAGGVPGRKRVQRSRWLRQSGGTPATQPLRFKRDQSCGGHVPVPRIAFLPRATACDSDRAK
jgi:hypothetical protein